MSKFTKESKKTTIGFIISHYNLRNDVRLLIEELDKRQDIDLILYALPREFEQIPDRYEKVRLKQTPRTAKNLFLQKRYEFFGNLPNTLQNYKDYIVRRHYKNKSSAWSKFRMKTELAFKSGLPQSVDFDAYMNSISFVSTPRVDEVDCFFSFTDVNNENILAEIYQKDKKIFTYVYSWDHISKFHKFSKNKIQYITWSGSFKRDLMKIHDVKEQNISSVASTQLAFIYDYLSTHQSKEKENYIYFVASFGYPKVAEQEIILLKIFAEKLQIIDPNAKIIFRPYPILDDWNFYGDLKKLPNLKFDSYKKEGDFYFSVSDIEYKLMKIQSALAVVHCGTTVGLEACYFDTPVIYLNVDDLDYGIKKTNKNHIIQSWNQYHLKTYFKRSEYKNVVEKKSDIDRLVRKIIDRDRDLMLYNHELRKVSKLMSLEKFASCLIQKFKNEKPSKLDSE